jgi:hypothetical protein
VVQWGAVAGGEATATAHNVAALVAAGDYAALVELLRCGNAARKAAAAGELQDRPGVQQRRQQGEDREGWGGGTAGGAAAVRRRGGEDGGGVDAQQPGEHQRQPARRRS